VRLLDRYLLREFGLPTLYCLDAFALLWVVMDLFGSVDDFLEHHTPVGDVVRYYLVMFPAVLVQIIPMSLLLGLLFCLGNLAKHRELLAMRAAGIGRARIAGPFLGVGLAASLLVFGFNELFVPAANEQVNSLKRVFRGKGQAGVIDHLFYANDRANRDWYARRFHVTSRELENPEVHERTADGQPYRDLYAERARWVNGQWLFSNVDLYDYAVSSSPPVVRVAETNLPALEDRPRQMALENKLPEEMSSSDLRRSIRSRTRSGRSPQTAPYRVALHYRYAFPLTCLVVVWVGLPLGMSAQGAGALRSVGTALLLVVVFYFATHITLALGSGDRLPPPLAAWLTNHVFASVGALLMWQTD